MGAKNKKKAQEDFLGPKTTNNQNFIYFIRLVSDNFPPETNFCE